MRTTFCRLNRHFCAPRPTLPNKGKPINPKPDGRSKKKLPERNSIGLELSRDIIEASAMPVGSFVTPISDLRRGNEENDASQLPILTKPVRDLIKGSNASIGTPLSPSSVVT